MTEPMRVLHVLGHMVQAGAETMVMNLYRQIDRSRVQFDFVVHTTEPCAYDEEIRRLGGRIYAVPAFRGTNYFAYRKAWETFFSAHPEYRIVHGHMRSTAAIYLRIAKKHGCNTIAHSHSVSSGMGGSAFVKNILQYPLRYRADVLLACSLDAGRWLFGNKAVTGKRFHLLRNGFPVEDYRYCEETRRQVRRELGLGDALVIGHVGRFYPVKNHVFLLQVFRELLALHPESTLILVGDGDLRGEMERQAERDNIREKILFLGLRADTPRLLQAMDVFVFPSLYEGLGLALLEAQAAGLPCIATDTLPKEAFLQPQAVKMSLDASASAWARGILELSDSERVDGADVIKRAGYDIAATAAWLESFYLRLNGHI